MLDEPTTLPNTTARIIPMIPMTADSRPVPAPDEHMESECKREWNRAPMVRDYLAGRPRRIAGAVHDSIVFGHRRGGAGARWRRSR